MSSLSAYRSRRRNLRIQLALSMVAVGFGFSRIVHDGGWMWAVAQIGFAGVAGYTLRQLQNNRRASCRAQILTGYRQDEGTQF